jgi:hypothetical protein
MNASVHVHDRPVVTRTAWSVDGALDMREWIKYGRRLGMLGRSVNWWIGDWLRYGNLRYGERYARAARVTGYDTQSLMNMVYVASRFAPPRRREQLSWSHHAELASLEPPEQDRWLALAEARRMSVHSVRLELRTARKAAAGLLAAGAEIASEACDGEAGRIVCPRCQHVIGARDQDAAQ